MAISNAPPLVVREILRHATMRGPDDEEETIDRLTAVQEWLNDKDEWGWATVGFVIHVSSAFFATVTVIATTLFYSFQVQGGSDDVRRGVYLVTLVLWLGIFLWLFLMGKLRSSYVEYCTRYKAMRRQKGFSIPPMETVTVIRVVATLALVPLTWFAP